MVRSRDPSSLSDRDVFSIHNKILVKTFRIHLVTELHKQDVLEYLRVVRH